MTPMSWVQQKWAAEMTSFWVMSRTRTDYDCSGTKNRTAVVRAACEPYWTKAQTASGLPV
jgi:hypothetical protein